MQKQEKFGLKLTAVSRLYVRGSIASRRKLKAFSCHCCRLVMDVVAWPLFFLYSLPTAVRWLRNHPNTFCSETPKSTYCYVMAQNEIRY